MSQSFDTHTDVRPPHPVHLPEIQRIHQGLLPVVLLPLPRLPVHHSPGVVPLAVHEVRDGVYRRLGYKEGSELLDVLHLDERCRDRLPKALSRPAGCRNTSVECPSTPLSCSRRSPCRSRIREHSPPLRRTLPLPPVLRLHPRLVQSVPRRVVQLVRRRRRRPGATTMNGRRSRLVYRSPDLQRKTREVLQTVRKLSALRRRVLPAVVRSVVLIVVLAWTFLKRRPPAVRPRPPRIFTTFVCHSHSPSALM